MQRYASEKARYDEARSDLDARQQTLTRKIADFAGEKTLGQCQQEWASIIEQHKALGDARRDLQRSLAHVDTLKAMVKTAQPPQKPDELTLSRQETDALLSSALTERSQNQLRLGQQIGRAHV